MPRLRALRLALVCGFLLALAVPGTAAAPEVIRTHDFEADAPDSLPEGWRLKRPASDGYRIHTSADAAHGGRRGLVLAMDQTPPSWNTVATVFARIDAKPWRGRRVRLSGWGRFHPHAGSNDGRGWFSLRVGLIDGWTGDQDNMPDRPISKPEWTRAELTVNVDGTADTLVYSALMTGRGRFEVDDLAITVLGPAGDGDRPGRPVSARGVENLAAFGRLAGIVRFFHPSDEAAALDWNAFVIDHVERVERAATPTELVTILRDAFAPIAPSVRIAAQPVPAGEGLTAPPADGSPARVGWVHHGFGGAVTRYIYRSERVSRPPATPGDVLPLGSEWSGALGANVHARVPLTLAKAGETTLPRPTAAMPTPHAGRPPGWTASGNDRATRLGDVLLAGAVLEHFYPYADVVRLDMSLAVREALGSAATDTRTSFTATLGRLSSHLRDGHGYVSGPGRPTRWLPVAFEFVGNDLAVIASNDSGARVGDVVTAIDGRPAAEVVAEQRARLSASTEGHMHARLSQTMMMSDAPRTLTLRNPAGATRDVRLAVSTDRLPPPPADPDSIAELRPGIFYVDLERISDADWRRDVDRIAKGKGLIFDLRGYPSGLSTLPIAHLIGDKVWCARWNVPVVRRPFMADVEWDTAGRWAVSPMQPRITAPVAFLTDGRAVSYSETWMGIIEAYRLATIVGEPTAGTNGNVNSIVLPGGYSMAYTGMKVLKHDGSRHHGVGIHPTVPAARTVAGLAAGRDEALERAIEVVSGRP